MRFTFLDMAGAVLFTREDAERAEWTHEELSIDLDFPLLNNKEIDTGQRIFFVDRFGNHQIFEVKQPRTTASDAYQQVHAEHICISELTDEHKDNIEITDKTAVEALRQVLSGTLWQVGNSEINPTSSADFSRGSVWADVLTVRDNWNVRIIPRVSLSSNGDIVRYLDIKKPGGTFNGIVLSIEKNLNDPAIIVDDSEVATALFGYGGTINAKTTTGENTQCDFSEVVWKAENGHPAKPKGQKWIEDPEATRLFGRNGRKRWGYYQNNSITDPEILLEKTWEALKQSNSPSVSVESTVTDLHRFGYADQPLQCWDIAICEIKNFKKELQIISFVENLLDFGNSSVILGDYIPNIVYISRKTDINATGSRGGGGNKSKEPERKEFETAIESINEGTGLRFRAFQNDLDDMDAEVKKQEASITIEHNRITAEVNDRRDADNMLGSRITQTANAITAEVNRASNAEGKLSGKLSITANAITAEVTRAKDAENAMSSRITQTADAITAEVTRATAKEGELSGKLSITADAITAEVNRAKGAENSMSSRITQTADAITAEVTRATAKEGELSAAIQINADGISTKVSKNGVISAINQTAETIKISASKIELDGETIAQSITGEDIDVGIVDAQDVVTLNVSTNTFDSSGDVDCGGSLFIGGDLNLNGSSHTPKWKSATYHTVTSSNAHSFIYKISGVENTEYGSLVKGVTPHTIYFLGYDN